MISNIQPGDEGVYVCVATEGGVGPRTVIAGCLIVHGELTQPLCICTYICKAHLFAFERN